ncbi:hypothetical protein T484DRAFT_1885101 [Baffinella frigidus]|nr:hypothetical protein T484DRAFT_1885101 [Cryptophyta sp. CCMP2293]
MSAARAADRAARRVLHKEREVAAVVAAADELHQKLSASIAPVICLGDDGLLDLDSLGSARPGSSNKPFCCAVSIEVRGQTAEQGIEQGSAIVREVQASIDRGPECLSKRQAVQFQSCVMWRNLGAASLRLDPSKSNRINWLDKAWAAGHWASTWASQREMLQAELPHAASWLDVLEAAYEDGGMDIKDDCRLDDCSALSHQDGGNAIVRLDGLQPLVRLAINVSSRKSARSLDYLEMAAEGRLVDGAERRSLLVHSVSQDAMWHGAAQTAHGYVQGLSEVCHSSSAGTGPCLKRIITVFQLPQGHALASLGAVQRLRRVGITLRAVDRCHAVVSSQLSP